MKQYTSAELTSIREESILQNRVRPRAVSVRYDVTSKDISMELNNSVKVSIPAHLVEGLLAGVFGTQNWMQDLAAKYGRRGGRPRKDGT